METIKNNNNFSDKKNNLDYNYFDIQEENQK